MPNQRNYNSQYWILTHKIAKKKTMKKVIIITKFLENEAEWAQSVPGETTKPNSQR